MTNSLAAKAYRLIRPLTAPITTRLAFRFRRLAVEANADLMAQTAQVDQRIGTLSEAVAPVAAYAQRLQAIEQYLGRLEQMQAASLEAQKGLQGLLQVTAELHQRQDSFDFKLVELARQLREVNQILRNAPDPAAAIPVMDKGTEVVEQLRGQFDAALLHLQELRQDTAELSEISRKLEFVKSRLSSYAGEGTVLTYLRDESPLFVNTGDLGCPSPIMDGGVWERENTIILRSFITDRTTFVDVGANVGYFTIAIGNHLKQVAGTVFSVEPHPKMRHLIERSVQLNGLENVVHLLGGAASDTTGEVELFYPNGHIGQGSLHHSGDGVGETIRTHAFRLDDVLPRDLTVDLIKIDVEGHEAHVLRGMREVLRRSPDIKILFEKLANADTSAADEDAGAILRAHGLDLFGVGADAILVPLDDIQYRNWVGDVLAAPTEQTIEPDRNRFSIYPRQLLGEGEAIASGVRYATASGGTLFFGPYWHLEAGTWRVHLHGDIEGVVHLVVAGNGNSTALEIQLNDNVAGGRIMLPYDLFGFEVRAIGEAGASITLNKIEFVRERIPTGPRACSSNEEPAANPS
ncbi:FkbM family methyltransferase [Xanthomonas sacchari]|uniref:FkbM family methyltransferase n=1 Tax=Xanthomonas sacchari TaxID=56458 RepID=UPI0031BC9E8B|nr:FkbM family methyltransferase [Xanthomonas campestris pv. cannae]